MRSEGRTPRPAWPALAVAAATALLIGAPQAAAATSTPATTPAAALAAHTAAHTAATNVNAAPKAVPGPPSGWSTVFSDDFTGSAGSAPSGANWIYDTGPGSNFGTGEIETMTNSTSNVHLDGAGDLDITALGSGGNWTSGRIQTPTANVGAPAGGELEVTASIEQPNPGSGLGYWPAFWMLGPGQWPENGEIDILEDVNALSQHSGTFHCGVDPGGPCDETNGIGSGLQGCGGCQTGFHTYTAIVNRTNTSAESITWYLDGNQFYQVNENQVDTATWQSAVDHNFSIILDLAMGGGYPNGACGCTTPTSATTSGASMSVAYVAAYSTGSGSTGGGSGGGDGGSQITGPGGLCLDDRGGSTADYNPVQGYTCNGTTAQQRTVVAAGSTLHVLGKCLDVDAAGTADGTPVDIYDCNNTGSQVFIPQSGGALYNPQSGKCLDDPNSSTTPGTQLQIWDCNNGTAQQWHLP